MQVKIKLSPLGSKSIHSYWDNWTKALFVSDPNEKKLIFPGFFIFNWIYWKLKHEEFDVGKTCLGKRMIWKWRLTSLTSSEKVVICNWPCGCACALPFSSFNFNSSIPFSNPSESIIMTQNCKTLNPKNSTFHDTCATKKNNTVYKHHTETN